MIACKYAILILKLFEYVKSAVFLITVHLFSVWHTSFEPGEKCTKQTDFNLRHDILMVFSPHTHSLTHTRMPVCAWCGARINYMSGEYYDESCCRRYARYADRKIWNILFQCIRTQDTNKPSEWNIILEFQYFSSFFLFRVSSGISSALRFTFCLQVYFMAYRAQPNAQCVSVAAGFPILPYFVVIMCLNVCYIFRCFFTCK